MKSKQQRETIVVHKKEGQTPLEAIEQLRKNNPQYLHTTIAYAGRLDPMAHGKLLLLLDEACKQREKYLSLDKEYVVEVLVGVGSDTHDILGLSELGDTEVDTHENNIRRIFKRLGKQTSMPYPEFSSKTVDGVPLFEHALRGTIGDIQIPNKAMKIYSLKYEGQYRISAGALHEQILRRISQVSSDDNPRKKLGRDFRRKEIIHQWAEVLNKAQAQEYAIVQLRAVVSSGTYMRVLARQIGEELGTQALAWSIERTQIGEYQSMGPWGRWKQIYTYHET